MNKKIIGFIVVIVIILVTLFFFKQTNSDYSKDYGKKDEVVTLETIVDTVIEDKEGEVEDELIEIEETDDSLESAILELENLDF